MPHTMTQTRRQENTAAGITESLSSNIVANHLDVTLANAIVTYQKLHHYHWRVTGDQFFRLHEKFEELYKTFGEILDDVAERILAIGGQPIGTLEAAIEAANVAEDNSVPMPRKMVENTLNDLALQRNQMQDVIAEAERVGDRGTVNLLDNICDGLEKSMWMLRSLLK